MDENNDFDICRDFPDIPSHSIERLIRKETERIYFQHRPRMNSGIDESTRKDARDLFKKLLDDTPKRTAAKSFLDDTQLLIEQGYSLATIPLEEKVRLLKQHSAYTEITNPKYPEGASVGRVEDTFRSVYFSAMQYPQNA